MVKEKFSVPFQSIYHILFTWLVNLCKIVFVSSTGTSAEQLEISCLIHSHVYMLGFNDYRIA